MIGPARLGLGRGSSGNGARGESGGRFNHYPIYVAAALSQSRTNEFRFTSWSRLKRKSSNKRWFVWTNCQKRRGPGRAAGTPSMWSKRSVARDRAAEPHVDADAGEPHRIAMREIGGDDRHGVLAVGEVDIERLRAHGYAIRPCPFGAEARDPAPPPFADVRLDQDRRSKVGPGRSELAAGNAAGHVEQQIVEHNPGAGACGGERVEAAGDVDVDPRRVGQELRRGLRARPVAVDLEAEQRIAARPVVADLAAGHAARLFLNNRHGVDDGPILIGAVRDPEDAAAIEADIAAVEPGRG